MATPPRPPVMRRLRAPNDTMRIRVGDFELTKRGATRFDPHDLYHAALTLGWPYFALALLVLHLAINFLFATLYLLDPGGITNARPGSFLDVFFFSTETLATVGYGVMSPATAYTHFVATVEIICGLAFTAIMTGLLFVRFSRPKAKIAYADHAVIATHNGCPTLMIRIGNARQSLLTDARVRLTALMRETTSEGHAFRYTRDLVLVRAENPLFALTWTLMHRIDEQSPLCGFTAQDLADMEVRMFLTVEARDHALAAQVHDLKDYNHTNILFDTRYVDAVTTDADGNTLADLHLISLVEPDCKEPHP